MKKAIVLIAALLMGCSQTTSSGSGLPSINSLSLLLKENDTEDLVVKKIGYTPTKVEFSACGPTRSTPCKIYSYEGGGKTLYIIFVSNRVITSFKVPIDQIPNEESQINSTNANFEYMWMVASWKVLDF